MLYSILGVPSWYEYFLVYLVFRHLMIPVQVLENKVLRKVSEFPLYI
jgi:hypothetical protein